MDTVIRQIYSASGVLAFAGTFMPLWSPITPGDDFTSMNLWSASGASGGGSALVGVMLMLVLVALLFSAAGRPTRSYPVPVFVGILSFIGAVMLVAKPGAGSPEPAFGAGAGTLFALTVLVTIVAMADCVRISWQEQDAAPGFVLPPATGDESWQDTQNAG